MVPFSPRKRVKQEGAESDATDRTADISGGGDAHKRGRVVFKARWNRLVFPWVFPGVFAWGRRLRKLQHVHESTGRDGAMPAGGYSQGVRSQRHQRQETCEEVQSRRRWGILQGTQQETVHGVDGAEIEPRTGVAGCGEVTGRSSGAVEGKAGYALSSYPLGPVGGA